jgi:hypothetical protein
MSIRTIESVVNIDESRRLVLQLPSDIPLAVHRVVAVFDEAAEADLPASGVAGEWSFPIIANASWPADRPLSRQEM